MEKRREERDAIPPSLTVTAAAAIAVVVAAAVAVVGLPIRALGLLGFFYLLNGWEFKFGCEILKMNSI